MPDSPRPKLPRVFKTLGWFLAFDFLVAYWLAIHKDKALELLVSLIPLAGIAGLSWSFFSKPRKEEFAEWLEAWLGARLAPWVAALLFVAGVAITNTRAGVTVTAVEGSVATQLRLTRGTALDAQTLAAADTARLNAITSPVSFIRRMGPKGDEAWLVSDDLISRQVVRLRPWRPLDLLYPTDFDSLVTISLLPGGWMFNLGLSGASMVLLGGRDAHDTLVAFTMDSSTTSYQLHAFAPRDPVPMDSTGWGDLLLAAEEDDSTLAERWGRHVGRLTTRRPVRQGERVTWTVHIGSVTQSRRVVLNHAHENLYLAF